MKSRKHTLLITPPYSLVIVLCPVVPCQDSKFALIQAVAAAPGFTHFLDEGTQGGVQRLLSQGPYFLGERVEDPQVL